MTKQTLGIVLVAVVLGLVTLACRVGLLTDMGGATITPTLPSSPSLTPTGMAQSGTPEVAVTPLTPHDIAARSAERMAGVQSFHFSVQVSGSPVHLESLINSPVPLLLNSIEGDVARPDQMKAQITVSTLGIATQIGLIRHAGNTYLSNPLVGGWEQLSAETGTALDPSLLFSPEQGLPSMLPSLNLQMVGFGEVQGEVAYQLQAKVVEGIDMTGFGGQKTAAVDVWVGMQTFLLRRARVTEVAPDAKEPTVWLLTLSAFDQPVTITPPSAQ